MENRSFPTGSIVLSCKYYIEPFCGMSSLSASYELRNLHTRQLWKCKSPRQCMYCVLIFPGHANPTFLTAIHEVSDFRLVGNCQRGLWRNFNSSAELQIPLNIDVGARNTQYIQGLELSQSPEFSYSLARTVVQNGIQYTIYFIGSSSLNFFWNLIIILKWITLSGILRCQKQITFIISFQNDLYQHRHSCQCQMLVCFYGLLIYRIWKYQHITKWEHKVSWFAMQIFF
jgi:hypothetical protein